jgi:hypothetical protein
MTPTAIILLLVFVFGVGLIFGAYGEEKAESVGMSFIILTTVIAVTRLCVLHF